MGSTAQDGQGAHHRMEEQHRMGAQHRTGSTGQEGEHGTGWEHRTGRTAQDREHSTGWRAQHKMESTAQDGAGEALAPPSRSPQAQPLEQESSYLL